MFSKIANCLFYGVIHKLHGVMIVWVIIGGGKRITDFVRAHIVGKTEYFAHNWLTAFSQLSNDFSPLFVGTLFDQNISDTECETLELKK